MITNRSVVRTVSSTSGETCECSTTNVRGSARTASYSWIEIAITLEQSGRPHSQTMRTYSAAEVGRASSIPSLISRATASLRAIRASRSLMGPAGDAALLLLLLRHLVRHLAGRLPRDVLHGAFGLLHLALRFQPPVLRHPADFLLHAADRLVLLALRL